MPKIYPFGVVGLILAVSACGPAPEREDDAAAVATEAPAPEPTEQAAGEAASLPPPGENSVPAGAPRPRRDRGEQTLRGLEQRMLAGFDRQDIDGDGRLTPDELGAGEGPDGARMLRRADEDGDGTLTRDEVRRAATRLFAMMDVDGDGVVTAEERPARRP
ncbi:EF-hand domain-containing protein [Brevundimonas sp. A19_0]|uniref:EF-hand domain-containing protein n=1 Tax=Brevundimonas sp. A19_0 TaxID=2821087 RepID=UPI001ADC4639|nr:EF-hand domain-containing protein [Brevundimonas sp. A19_0]MBO9501713.1 EF-hand domain-containing protein [Brevundimonas sp. A19_0]